MGERFIPVTSAKAGSGEEVAADVYIYTNQVVNLFFVGLPEGKWVMVDAGMPKSADNILKEVEKRFGAGSKPEAIILTHGHFDHVGGINELLDEWEVPVYAHEQELGHLTGKQDYPEPDATVEGGMVAKMSPMFPNQAINIENYVHPLKENGSIPEMPGWSWIHTPGHTPGHVSLFREEDRFLIAGDAFVTVKQESLYKVATQKLEISGPPRYLTTDWEKARDSVKKLQELKPCTAGTGHGKEMHGEQLTENLDYLVTYFDEIAIPDKGRFVDNDKE
ncbi:MBL fold metallo-hydrolase [Salibacterium sp. K-3]